MSGGTQLASMEVKWGAVRLRRLALTVLPNLNATKATISIGGKALESTFTTDAGRIEITLSNDVVVAAGQILEATLS
jgi:hypothetical protein